MTTTSTSRRRPRRSAAKPPEPKFEQSGPPILRTCALCYSKQPLAELGAYGTSLCCLDDAACKERAATSGMYPTTVVGAMDQELAIREAQQGAIRRRTEDADLAALRHDNEQRRLATARARALDLT
jgi:hypothetical protein